MRYWYHFTNAGVPETGLSPTISVWRFGDGTSAGTPPTVTEMSAANAPGWYYFDATPEQPVLVTVDGTATLADADRYVARVISPDDYPQTNRRVVYSSWDERGNPIAGQELLYESAEDLEADADPWAGAAQTYEITATYNTSNRLTEVTRTKA